MNARFPLTPSFAEPTEGGPALCLGERESTRSVGDEGLRDFSVFQDFDPSADLSDNSAGIAPHERVAANVLPTFHGLEKEGLRRTANFAIGGKRGFDVGEQAAGDRD